MQAAAPNMDMGEPNFRQIGTKRGGKLMLGHIVRSRPSTSSIPSKFETILYKGDRENKGFGSRDTRFKPSLADLPGPGAYPKSASQRTLGAKSDSHSKKGFGNGFASQTKRFFVPTRRRLPGPGQYATTDSIGTAGKKDHHRGQGSSSFLTKQSQSMLPKRAETVPGPGQYMTSDPEKQKPVRRGRTMMKDNLRKRFWLKVAKSQGVYVGSGGPSAMTAEEEEQAVQAAKKHTAERAVVMSNAEDGSNAGDKRKNKSRRKSRRGHGRPGDDQPFLTTAPRFKQRIERKPAPGQYNPSLPRDIHKAEEPVAAFASKAKRVTVDVRQAALAPGPGHYDAYAPEEMYIVEEGESSMFKNNAVDRFGKPVNRRTQPAQPPGPGAYTVKSTFDPREKHIPRGKIKNGKPLNTAPVTSAMFTSTMERLAKQQVVDAPGPAYYNPNPIGIKENRSFHLNTKLQWM